jgi:YDG domain
VVATADRLPTLVRVTDLDETVSGDRATLPGLTAWHWGLSLVPLAVTDGNAYATIATRSLDGAIGGDDVTLSGGTATFADKNVGASKTVTGSGFALSGADAGNYLLSPIGATAADITARPITVMVISQSKTYGNSDPTLTYSVTAVMGWSPATTSPAASCAPRAKTSAATRSGKGRCRWAATTTSPSLGLT